eukprot:scaffold190376_cov35-Tisochrysis_lutea.AAC.2
MPGVWVKLKKPLAVLSKVMDGDSQQVELIGSAPCEYHAIGVIREKLVFKTRPTPITRTLLQGTSAKRQKP